MLRCLASNSSAMKVTVLDRRPLQRTVLHLRSNPGSYLITGKTY